MGGVPSGFSFSQELISETFDECYNLYKEHAEEHQRNVPFNLNKEVYVAAEKAGNATVFYVRDAEGKAVGFAGYLLQVNPHSGLSHAYCDSLYLKREYRIGWVGHNFMKFCDEKLRSVGVRQFQHAAPLSPGGAALGGILVRQGYKAIEVIYQKVLGNGESNG